MPRLSTPLLPLLLVLAVQTGCGGDAVRITEGTYAAKSAHVSSLNHVVLISLRDPADAPERLADCREMLARVDSVETICVGTHTDTGRDAVDGNYDVGLCVGLADAEALQAYLDHPSHLELVRKWAPRAAGFRIFDVGGATSDR